MTTDSSDPIHATDPGADAETAAAARAWAQAARRVAVIGAGTMGEGIAQSFAEAGLAVRLIDIAPAALDRCREQIAQNIAQAERCGLESEGAAAVLGRIEFVASTEPAREVAGAELVVETVPEVLGLKRELLAALDALPEDVLIGSNSSSMTVDAMCSGMRTAHRVVGLHYFNPAHIIPAVELHGGTDTGAASVARARALLLRAGKAPFWVRKAIPGFVINRLTGALMREIYHLLDEGVITPEELDVGVKASLGFRMAWMGPMESADHTGLDVGVRVVSALLPQLSTRITPSKILLENVAAGHLGVKTGRGWLDHGGRSRAELLEDRNHRLLRQLKSYQETKAKP